MPSPRSRFIRLMALALCLMAIGFSLHWTFAQAAAPIEPLARGSTADRSGHPLDAEVSFTPAYTIHLPLILQNYPVALEVRAIWITRFDWTSYHHTVTTADIDAIVDNVAAAHFNLILFQIRGTADAYYSSTLEPWAARLTGEVTQTLGQSPGFDPLAYMIDRAHARNIQVHAYLNVYPTWLCDSEGPIKNTVPLHPFWKWTYQTPSPAGIPSTFFWREWSNTPLAPMNLIPTSQPGGTCGSPVYLGGYLWASPAAAIVQAHIVSVTVDLAARYNIDGLHLDNVRYSGSNYSSDPTTLQAFSDALAISPTLDFTTWRPAFQRAQVSSLVAQIYSATTATKPKLLLSAAVWPNYATGTNSYFQDSKGWLANGTLDASLPMLYSSDIVNDLTAWTNRAQDFVNDAHGRYVIPGIGVQYTSNNQTFCVPFVDLQARIEAARAMNAPGTVFFSYSGINNCGYWSDLANGPFALPAIVPQPDWK